MVQHYHTVGGAEGHIRGPQTTHQWENIEKPLAKSLAGPDSPLRRNGVEDGPVELVLGIKRTGASYLLLTADEARECTRRLQWPLIRAMPLSSERFESLSPIAFSGVEELSKKLTALKPKSGRGRTTVDSSSANRIYNVDGEDGIARGGFEHNRVLYRILLGGFDFDRYSLRSAPWAQSLRVCSFVYNVWTRDNRRFLERKRLPRVLDVGFAEVEVPSITLKPGTSSHFIVKSNSLLVPEKDKEPFRFGNTETLPEDEIGTRIRNFLVPAAAAERQRPTVLLTCGTEATEFALQRFGITLHTRSLKPLLQYQESSRSAGRHDRGRSDDFSSNRAASRRYAGYDGRRDSRRSRSRSPGRRQAGPSAPRDPRTRYDDASYSSTSGSRDSGKPADPDDAPFYVVDVKQMYLTMMQETEPETNPLTTVDIAERLGIPRDAGLCAGNEASLAIEIWKAMSSGPSIDEQRESRLASSRGQPEDADDLQQTGAADRMDADDDGDDDDDDDEDDDDEERDPNDYNPPAPGNAPLSHQIASIDPDDVSDYGSDD